MDLQVGVLGPVSVHRGHEEVFVNRPAQRRLLSLLVLADGGRVSTDVLIDRFWNGDPPDTARAAIQTHISGLRRELGNDVVATEGYGYRLSTDGIEVDVDTFNRLAEESRASSRSREWKRALEQTEDALALWRGDPYSELADDDFARPEIARLSELRLELLGRRAESLIELGHSESAVPDLEALVLEHPLRERYWEHLMSARYRLGRNSDALRAYREILERLAEIGVEPNPHLQQLEEKILLHDASLRETRNNLPTALDSFIGRTDELDRIAKLLADSRLVTLTGAGGSGKTRLAVQAARRLLGQYPDGVYFVELASVSEPELIPTEIARVLDVRPSDEELTETIAKHLRDEAALLILDNCEHLIDGAARVARALLEGGPRVSVLATSRSPLRIPGENTSQVPGLSHAPKGSTYAEALEYDAVRLFSDRAAAADGFDLTSDNVEHVIEICLRLDGMPLAIELAAVRTNSITPEAIAGKLDNRFRLLTTGSPTGPTKHQTLEAAIEWSYRLLTPTEQIALNRLSVFRGGFEFEMAESVVSDESLAKEDVVPTISSLIDKSLVSLYDTEDRRRYRLLETIREFATDRLKESGHADRTDRAHVEWSAEFSRSFLDRLNDEGRRDRLARLHLEFDNLAAALQKAPEIEPRTMPLVMTAAALHWHDLGYLTRCYDTLTKARKLCDNELLCAEIDVHLSQVAYAVNRSEEAWDRAKAGYEVLKKGSPTPLSVLAAGRFANLHWVLIDRDAHAGLSFSRQAVEWAEQLKHLPLLVRSRTDLTTLLVSSGQEDAGLDELERTLSLIEKLDEPEIVLANYYAAITTLFTVRSARRDRPRQIVDRIYEAAESEEQVVRFAGDWTAFVHMQTGEFDEASRILELDAASDHLEAMDELSMLIPRSFLSWMQGDLESAAGDITRSESIGVNPRWYHDFLSVKAEVAADRGVVSDARAAAEFYLAFDVAASEQVKKLGTLHPLVRAEVEAALNGGPDDSASHMERARSALGKMREILKDFPAPSSGSYMAETHDTHLTFAAAEVSRLTQSDPELWKAAYGEADFIYYRLYAQIRLGDALFRSGRESSGIDAVRAGHAEASKIGARLLASKALNIGQANGFELSNPATPTGSSG